VASPTYTDVHLRLPTFAVLILQQRARDDGVSLSEVAESALLEDVMIDEVQRVAQTSPEAAEAVQNWFQASVAKDRGRNRERREP
jgi:hypothetical protein